MGIAERVRFLGFVNQSGLPETYCASDVLVLPSSYEPFGVVVNEAMLCGCSVNRERLRGCGVRPRARRANWFHLSVREYRTS